MKPSVILNIPSVKIRKGLRSALLEPKVRPVIMIGIVPAMFQQWCGINVIFNYAQEILPLPGLILTVR